MKFDFDGLLDGEASERLGNQLLDKVGIPLPSPFPFSLKARSAGGVVFHLTYVIKEIHEATANGRFSDRKRDANEIVKKCEELKSLLSSFESNFVGIPSQEYIDLNKIYYLPSAINHLDAIRSNFEREIAAAEYGSRNMNGYSHFIGVRCAEEFKRLFCEEPKITYDRTKQRYSGAFLRFVRFMFERVEMDYADASIYKALKRNVKDKVPELS
jgi:predicted translin family RNA/ssDNA-binding protein